MAIGKEEVDLVSGLFSFLSVKPIIFDAGSNKGCWADIMLKEYGDNCTIHLFEPNKMLLDYTRIKYEYRKNIVYNEIAISLYEGEKDFYYFENFNNELSSLYKQDWWEKELPMKVGVVKTTSIDKYCQDNGIKYVDYLKIDCEGGDVEVFASAIRFLKEEKIRFIQIEYGGHYQTSKKKFLDVIGIANAMQYQVYSYDGNNYNEVKKETFQEDYHYENYIITKEEIHNYTVGWDREFIESTKDLGKFDFVLEVGCAEGLTSKYICENLLENNGRMIAVDPLKDVYREGHEDYYTFFKQQYQRFVRNTRGLPIELFREDSRKVLPRFHAFRFSLCYIDGDHSEEVVYRDAVNCFPITKLGGYILFDDWDNWSKETKRGIDTFLMEYETKYEIIKSGYQLLIKKTND